MKRKVDTDEALCLPGKLGGILVKFSLIRSSFYVSNADCGACRVNIYSSICHSDKMGCRAAPDLCVICERDKIFFRQSPHYPVKELKKYMEMRN